MFEQIYSGFVKGEIYYIKTVNGVIMGDLLFDRYNYSNTGVWFNDIVGDYAYLFQFNEVHMYRYVSEQEYSTKLKEKYHMNCLNSVLKRLVNENFEW